MAYPERYHIEALKKLRGDAYVTFPTSDLAARVVERVYSVPREKAASPDAFNAPQTFEYTDTQLIEQHFVGGDAIYVEVYQKWETLPGSQLVTKSIGVPDSLIPEKYRRLIRTIETNQPVGPDYVFPSGLTGDQRFISLAMETIAKLRLKIIEEVIISSEDPLTGEKFDEWGTLTIQESIVTDGDPVDVGFLVKDSSVTPLGNGKSIKITVLYPSDLASKEHPGQEIEQQIDVVIPFIRSIAPLGDQIGDPHKRITPIDDERAMVESYDQTALDAALGAYFRPMPSTIERLLLPDELLDVNVVYQASSGDGGYDETGSETAYGENISLHLQLNADAQASAAIMPDIQPQIREIWSHNLPIMRYLFFMKAPYDVDDILARLTAEIGAVTAWPVFKPEANTITLKGERVSVNVRGNVQQHYSHNNSTDFGASASHTKGSGAGTSREVGITVRTERIPPTLHEEISVAGSSNEPISAEAVASMSGNGGGWDDMTSPPAVESSNVVGEIAGTIAATNPTAVPTSGQRLKSMEIDPFRGGWDKVRAEVFDFAYLA